ncbi:MULTISPECIES: glycosyltransferase [unclassified Anaeromyxobacter]|uniref:glycosyltransferase n=1 Tax=unclassified Anaeromyxobacter TaxID=2620896 RepID=UPI001F598828|nr:MULTISPECIES: glycosyltransferase [unclassified Anaeromyxobacter]
MGVGLRRAVRAAISLGGPEAVYAAKKGAIALRARLPAPLLRARHAAALAALDARIAEARGVVVYLPTINWGYLHQRPHQLLRELGRRGYVGVFCTCNPAADAVEGLREVEPNVFLCADPRLVAHLARPILWLNWTVNEAWLSAFRHPRLVYEYIDELEVFSMHCRRMHADHDALVRRADVVVASADRLHAAIRAARPDAVLAPNGVHAPDFRGREGEAPPEDLARIVALGRPIVGYYGALARWLDFELLNRVTQDGAELSFVVIGPDHDGSAARIASRPNVHVLGERPYGELARYSRRFDVAIIPFEVSEVTRSTSPVKLFEYMAAGAPIVTTPMDECRKYRSVTTAATPAEFLSAVRAAVGRRGDAAYQALLAREVQQNTWGERVDRVLAALDAGATAPAERRRA